MKKLFLWLNYDRYGLRLFYPEDILYVVMFLCFATAIVLLFG